MYLLAIALTPELQSAIGIGAVVVALVALLTLLWLVLQIVGWFRPKDAYATKEEVGELRGEVKAINNSIQTGFNDLHRAIGRLEGKQ